MGRVTLLATAIDRDDMVAAAEEREHRVHLIGLRPPNRLATFEGLLDFGGHRLALCTPDSGPIVLTGAWERYGVCAYDGLTGVRHWQRKDLKRVQTLSPAATGALVAVGLDMRAMQLLDVATGTTELKLRAADRLWQSRYASRALTNYYDAVALYDSESWRRLWARTVPGHGALSAAFAPDAVLVSSLGLTCLDFQGTIRWEARPPDMVGYNPVAWDAEAHEWIGVEGHANRLIPESIVRWSEGGTFLGRVPVTGASHGDAAFLPGGRLLLTVSGTMIDTVSGRTSGVVGNLALN